jgi:hypothetical protein
MPTASTAAKPSYLGLLNAISLAETNAGVLLEAWADATPNEELASVLRLVAARETSHGALFCRQLRELGFDLRRKTDPQAAKRLAKFADPDVSDVEKVGPERPQTGDEFAEIERRLADGEFDPMTANLLTWFIAEERDSGGRLREAYACVRSAAVNGARKANGHAVDQESGPSADAAAIMACMTAGFSRLEKSLEKLAKAVK